MNDTLLNEYINQYTRINEVWTNTHYMTALKLYECLKQDVIRYQSHNLPTTNKEGCIKLVSLLEDKIEEFGYN